jgi:hypothetical protein
VSFSRAHCSLPLPLNIAHCTYIGTLHLALPLRACVSSIVTSSDSGNERRIFPLLLHLCSACFELLCSAPSLPLPLSPLSPSLLLRPCAVAVACVVPNCRRRLILFCSQDGHLEVSFSHAPSIAREGEGVDLAPTRFSPRGSCWWTGKGKLLCARGARRAARGARRGHRDVIAVCSRDGPYSP